MIMLDQWPDLRDYQIMEGDCLLKMREIPSESIDAILTDPPYGLGFMGKEWDVSVPGIEWARECLRVLKPGGHLIAFGGTRTIHRLTCAIEDAGFEIRDMISWLYFSGFPKNHDISKAIDREAGAQREIIGKHANPASEIFSGGSLKKDVPITKPKTEDAQRYEGFGTALKPAQEPAVLARKPIESGLTIAQNVLKHGVGAINIDDCRFGYGDPCWVGPQDEIENMVGRIRGGSTGLGSKINGFTINNRPSDLGRWPANIYQCPKPSRAEREAGLSHLKKKTSRSSMNTYNGQGERFDGAPSPEVLNIHPTVKPIKLFRWLSRLIGMEKGNTILDPFCGSGTTGCAALLESYNFIGIEREKEYIPIIEGRCEWAKNQYKRENAQLSLFDDLT